MTNQGSAAFTGDISVKAETSSLYVDVEFVSQPIASLENLAVGESYDIILRVTTSSSTPKGETAVVVLELEASDTKKQYLFYSFRSHNHYHWHTLNCHLVTSFIWTSASMLLKEHLEENSLSYDVIKTQTTITAEDLEARSVVFVLLGVYSDNFTLTSAISNTLETYLEAGGSLFRRW